MERNIREIILSKIKCTRTYLRKSEMCSGNAYKITLSYHGKRCSFVFHDNFKNQSNKRDFVYCLVLDAQAYDNTRDLYEFAREFGYLRYADVGDADAMQRARKARKACEKQSERLHRLFNDNEIDFLSTIE